MNINNDVKPTLSQEYLEHAQELTGSESLNFCLHQAEILSSLIHEHAAPNATVLDFGCGDGTIAYLLSGLLPTLSIHGTDLESELVEIAQKWYTPERSQLTFEKIERMRNHPITYDVIFLTDVLHHIAREKQEAVLAQLAGMLSPHGILMVLEFNPYNPMQCIRFYTDTDEQGNHMIRPSRIQQYCAQFKNNEIAYHKLLNTPNTLIERIKNAFRIPELYSIIFFK